jgi:predicted TIM-barrel fold metal-dependent hydrolase
MNLPISETRALHSLKIIDADTHLTEPHDLWVRRAPASLRARVPQVKIHQGVRSWVIDGDKSIGTGAHPSSAIRKDGSKARTIEDFNALTFEDVHPGSSETKPRLAVMDKCGIWAQVVYPNILGFGGQATAKVEPNLRLACVQIFNDAMAEMQGESNDRLFPMALLPWWDIDAAVTEMQRAHKLGLRGVNINSDPHYHTGNDGNAIPDLASTHWDPLWDVCQALNLPINFHIGASEQSMDWLGQQGWPSLSTSLKAGLGGAMLFFNNGRVMSNIIYGGALDRFPALKFVSVESGIGWVPFMLEALNYQLKEIAENTKLALTPKEYFQRNFYGCFWFEEENIADTIRKVGVDRVMFETDFPHPTGLYPIENLEQRLAGLTANETAKVMSLNAAGLYRIPI